MLCLSASGQPVPLPAEDVVASIWDTLRMVSMPILAGRDHLAQYAKQSAVDALVELIWNGLNAEADEVDVDIESSSLGTTDRDMYYVTRITVTDTGHGITPDIASPRFHRSGTLGSGL